MSAKWIISFTHTYDSRLLKEQKVAHITISGVSRKGGGFFTCGSYISSSYVLPLLVITFWPVFVDSMENSSYFGKEKTTIYSLMLPSNLEKRMT